MLPMLIGCFYPPPLFPVGTSSIMNLCLCFWVSKKYCVSPSSPLCVSPSLCPFAFLCRPLPLCVVLSPPSSMCMLFFIIDQISLSPAQAKSLYGEVRWGLGTHLPQSCWDFFLLSTFPRWSAWIKNTGVQFGFCSRCCIAGGERVALLLLGWYFFFISCPIFSYCHSHLSLWKELIRVFCCPTVQLMSLQESQTGAFWYHEFLWPMERGYNVEKICAFHGCLIVFYEKCVLDIMHGSNKIKQNICTIYGQLFINPSYKMFHTS